MPSIHGIWVEPNRFPIGWRMPSHSHPGMVELIVVLSGKLETTINGVTRIAESGNVVLHPANRPHREASVGNEPLSTLFASRVGGLANTLDPEDWQRTDHDGRIAGALRWASDAFLANTPVGVSTAILLIDAALNQFSVTVANPQDDMVRKIRAHVLPRLAETITLDDLAGVAALSRHHFIRQFHLAAGQPPMRWLRALRLDAARHLLSTTELTVEAVGERVGFPDRLHFSRAMRQHTGRAPSGWRR